MSESSYHEEEHQCVRQNGYVLSLRPDRPDPIYSVDETFTVQVAVEKDGVPIDRTRAGFRMTADHEEVLEDGYIDIVHGGGVLSSKGRRPGFIQIVVSVPIGAGESLSMGCGVGIDPEHIDPSLPVPDDFDAFWDAQKKRLAQIPVESVWTPITKTSHPHLHHFSHKELLKADISRVELNYVGIRCCEKDVRGVYIRPRDRRPAAHPAVLCVHGAGVVPAQPHSKIYLAKKGLLALEINAHGILNDQDEAYYARMERELGAGANAYKHLGKQSRDTSYWVLVYLRVKRGLDFLMAQPEWDGINLFIRGNSQGGAQAIAGAYLEPKVNAVSANVPGHCDHTGFVKNRVCGWPQWVEFDKDGNPDQEMVTASRYFDSMNFLRRINCPGSFSASFLDTCCKPTSIYAAYNAFGGEKQIYHQPFTAHACTAGSEKATEAFFDKVLRRSGFRS